MLVPGALNSMHHDDQGEPVVTGPDWRDVAVGAAAFGGLFAAGWAISKRWGHKSAPE